MRTAIANSVLLAAVVWLLAAQGAFAGETRNVLELYSNNRLVPGNVDVDRGLRAALANTSMRTVVTYSEFLDEPEFGGPEYEANAARYLREKYSTRRPDAIVGVSNEAFAFLLCRRGELFPGIPLVHAAVATTYLQSIPPLPPDVVGNRNVPIIIAAVILLQALLIATLLIERRRRRVAELAVQKQRSELAHASRLAMAGELTASIAHEINQPLGAILASADAAEMLLEGGNDRRDDLRRIVARIRRDDLRASDVIGRLRTLLAKHKPERKRFEVNEAVTDVVVLLQGEARQRRVILESRTSSTPLHVVGDPIQIQQVLINLLLNAMDAVAGLPEDRRLIVVSADQVANGIQITVRDRGRGIAPEHLPKLFDSFFSTKQRGMGLGLSIARTIAEAHGGRIWAKNGPDDGAVFCVELPARDGANTAGAR